MPIPWKAEERESPEIEKAKEPNTQKSLGAKRPKEPRTPRKQEPQEKLEKAKVESSQCSSEEQEAESWK
jgi:hypothetical protein